MPLSQIPERRSAKQDRTVQVAVWTFAIVEEVGIAFALWYR